MAEENGGTPPADEWDPFEQPSAAPVRRGGRRNVSSPAAIEREREAGARRTALRQQDLKVLLDQVEGRRFVWRLLRSTGFFTRDRDLNTANMYAKQGRAEIGADLWHEIEQLNPHVLIKMQQDALTEMTDV